MRFIKSVVAAAMWLGVWYAVQYGLMYAGVGLVKTAAAFGLITISEAFAMHFNAIAPMAAEVAIVPVAWALFAMRKKPPLRSLGFAPCRVSSVIAGAILGFLACLTVTLLLVYTPFPESWQTDYTESSKEVLDRGSPVYTIIASVIVAPIVEEIVFRGLVYGRLRNGMPRVLAAVLSAAAFGFAHGSAIWVVYTALLGLLFAFVYEKTGSIVPTIALHMSFNIFGQITIFPASTPPLLVWAAYTFAPYALGVAVWCVAKTKKPLGGVIRYPDAR